ncbi:MAG: class I SAM-dependent methyltransferase [Candidatus Aenigmarchaeota archaeon]|nr:class I SAM-dependent methyltransferase [Candidatus Aenigmarchaeota archaeon]
MLLNMFSKKTSGENYDRSSGYHLSNFSFYGRVGLVFGGNIYPRRVEGRRLLDIGCSGGRTTEEISYACGNDAEGIDIMPGNIWIARRNRKKGIYSVQDGYRNSFPDKRFKAVFFLNGILQAMHIMTPEMTEERLGQVSRLVSDDGYLLLSRYSGIELYSREAYGSLILRRKGKRFETVQRRDDFRRESKRILDTVETFFERKVF